MTIRPCNEFIDCECSDNPFINTSAEAPDPNLFFARRYFPNNPSLNVDDSWYERATCAGVCYSEESQQDADDCALRMSQLCVWDPVRPPLTLLSDDPSSVPRTNIFGNVAVTCESPCPNGPSSVFTVPANTFYGLTQQEADAMARSVCEYRALVNRMCSSIPPEPPVCDVTITSVMPPSLMIEAAPGDNVAFGVTFDYTGMSQPIFLWLKDTFPLVQTQNPSLTISPVLEQDAGIYQLVIIIPQCPPVLSPVFTLTVNECIPTAGVNAPELALSPTGVSYFTYATPTSLGEFEAPESGNTHSPLFTENELLIGAMPPGFYEGIYRGGGRQENTDPPGVPFFTADAWTLRAEELGNPDTDVFGAPFSFAIFANCGLAENSVGGVGSSSIVFQTSNTSGGAMKLIGAAWPSTTNTMVSCNGSRPLIEVVHYALTPQPAGLSIVDFAEFSAALGICATCQDRLVGNEWNGMFFPEFYLLDFCSFRGVIGSSATAKFKNKRTNEASISIEPSTRGGSTPIWLLLIRCSLPGNPASGPGSQVVWAGYKEKGLTPGGVYLFNDEYVVCSGNESIPCITVEEIPPYSSDPIT